jgi:hypothetical protein
MDKQTKVWPVLSKEEFRKGYEAAALSEDDDFNASPAWRAGWLAWSRDANR